MIFYPQMNVNERKKSHLRSFTGNFEKFAGWNKRNGSTTKS